MLAAAGSRITALGALLVVAMSMGAASASYSFAQVYFVCEAESMFTGSIYFSQEEKGNGTKVTISLKYCDDNKTGTSRHKYHIHTHPWTGESCSELGGHFDPEKVEVEGYKCNQSEKEKCYAGDLSGKHGDLIFEGANYTNIEYIDNSFTIEDVHAIKGRGIVIHEAGGGPARVACASIGYTEVAKFDTGDVSGVVTFSHEGNDGSGSFIRVALNSASDHNSSGHLIHIHNNPVTGACATAGGHFDPSGVETDGYTCNKSKPEDCYVGDLSGKHGTIAMGNEVEFADLNIDISEISGRSVVVHAKDEGTSRIACASIGVTFVAPIRGIDGSNYGTVGFSQAQPGYPVRVRANWEGNTSGHMYHIHKHAIVADCDSALGHWDPTSKGGANYTCDDSKPLECEKGDLSGMFGTADLASTTTFQFVELKHVRDILGKSIVLHAADGGKARIGCGSIGRTIVAQFYAGANAAVGEVVFAQASSGSGHVKVTGNLAESTGATSSGHNYHIHENAVVGSCMSAGGHYDPEGKEGKQYKCMASELAECYKGDLSGKFGDLTLGSPFHYYDPTLELEDILGRSIVVHAANGGKDRIACATIGVSARAEFPAWSRFSTDISFASENFYSPTRVTRTILSRTGSNSTGHHIHAHPVTRDCASAGGHFDPKGVEIRGYACIPYQPETCYVGDLSGKFGDVDTSKSPAPVQDASINLFGKDSIVGRSVVIHAKEAGPERVACANIGITVTATLAHNQWSEQNVTTYGAAADLWGDISIAQTTPHGPATVRVNVKSKFETSSRHEYKIRKNSIIGDCTTSGSLYDPTGKFKPFYKCDSETSLDECYVGDLSGKHGPLDINVPITYTDTTMDVSDLLGRSVVIYANNISGTSYYRACANFGNVASAEFAADSEIEGVINFAESVGLGTRIMLELKGNVDLWARMARAPVPCARKLRVSGWPLRPRGRGHPLYDCNPDESVDCYVGDMSGKHGKLSISTNSKSRSLGIPTCLPLVVLGYLGVVWSLTLLAADLGALHAPR